MADIVMFRGSSSPAPVVVMGASFATIIGGIAFAGPWLTVGRGTDPGTSRARSAALLAARRLADDPRGSFGAIAGVIMAVFVASAFFSLAAYVQVAAGDSNATLRAGEVTASLTSGSSGQAVAARLVSVPGVVGLLPVPAVHFGDEASTSAARDHLPTSTLYTAWVVPCDRLLAVVDVSGASCGSASILTTISGGLPDGSYVVSRFDDQGNPETLLPGQAATQLKVDSANAGLLVPGNPGGIMGIPDVIIDPTALGSAAADLTFTQLYVATDGTAAAGERVRGAIQAIDPRANVLLPDDPVNQSPQFAEVGRIVGLGLIGSLALAGCSLAVATTTGLLQRRRQFALLRAAGMPVSRLRSIILLQAGVPLIAVSLVSALLGVGVAQGLLLTAGSRTCHCPTSRWSRCWARAWPWRWR